MKIHALYRNSRLNEFTISTSMNKQAPRRISMQVLGGETTSEDLLE